MAPFCGGDLISTEGVLELNGKCKLFLRKVKCELLLSNCAATKQDRAILLCVIALPLSIEENLAAAASDSDCGSSFRVVLGLAAAASCARFNFQALYNYMHAGVCSDHVDPL